MKYNHLYTIAFSVNSDKEDASDVTPDMLQNALRARCNAPDDEWLEMCDLADTEEAS
jgi:hypothetical protein